MLGVARSSWLNCNNSEYQNKETWYFAFGFLSLANAMKQTKPGKLEIRIWKGCLL